MQLGVVGYLALEKGGKVVKLCGGGVFRARAALTSIPFSPWSPDSLDGIGPAISWRVRFTALAVAGPGRDCRCMRCGIHNLPATRAVPRLWTPSLPKGRVGAPGATLFDFRALLARGSPERGSGGAAIASNSASGSRLRAALPCQECFVDRHGAALGLGGFRLDSLAGNNKGRGATSCHRLGKCGRNGRGAKL